MLKRLSLKETGKLVVFLLMLTGGGLSVSALLISNETNTAKETWAEFQLIRSEKARLGVLIRGAFGYGGMIHNFKNFVLRGNDTYLERTQDALGGLRLAFHQYSLLPLSGTEKAAIKDIERTISRYHDELHVAQREVNTGSDPIEIDELVKVDDSAAIRGLKTLSQEALPQETDKMQTTKAVLIGELMQAAGYGGMIHNYKNYLLRGTKSYCDKALANLAYLREVIGQYRKLEINRGEKIALEDLEGMVGAYSAAIKTIQTMKADNSLLAEIDHKIRIDDIPALNALALLTSQANEEVQVQSEAMSRSLAAISQMKNIISLGGLFLVGLITFILLRLLNFHIITPVGLISQAMRRIADGDYKTEIKEPDGDNEIATMTRDLIVLRKNSALRHEMELSLATANEEMKAQLAELQAMREQADEQAARAIELAENLSFAKEEADAAKALALADERRTRTIMNTVSDAIITSDSEGKIISFNLGAQVTFGYSEEEILGRNVSFLAPEPVRSQHDHFMKNFREGNSARTLGKTVEQTALRKDGHEFPVDITVNPMYIGEDISFIAVVRDITERKASEEAIRRLAMTDPLTGLCNRNAFNSKFEDAIAQSKRLDLHLALLMLDLDKFKPVNDQYGHPVGDALLIEISKHLKDICRDTDVVARLGGDEFAVILTNLENPDGAHGPAQKIIEALSTPMEIMGHTVQIGTSIGIALYPDHSEDMDSLITKADDALYEAKNAGRNTFRLSGTAEKKSA